MHYPTHSDSQGYEMDHQERRIPPRVGTVSYEGGIWQSSSHLPVNSTSLCAGLLFRRGFGGCVR